MSIRSWIKQLIAWLRRRPVTPIERVERHVREYMIGENGLQPVYPDHDGGERLMSRAEAEKFLDDICMNDWRYRGEPPCVIVGGERLYTENDLFEWVIGDVDVPTDPTTGEKLIRV